MPADNTIYDKLWQSDLNRLSVSVRDSQGLWVDGNADVLLDHQAKAGERRDIDAATRPLFAFVNVNKLYGMQTVKAYKKLLDNYLVNYRDPEDYTREEKAEDLEFLTLVMASEPMKLAYDYITTGLGKRVNRDEFQERLWKIWFEPYTNYFTPNRPTEFASGFEHVFVGEGKYDYGVGVRRGEVDGYHDWIKFFIDESLGRVDFRGTKYNLRGTPDVRSPNVVTLQMVWNLMNTSGEIVAELFKKIGGFFVGLSPECSMAMGTVGFYESVQELTINERRNVVIQGESYNLVVYRETRQDGQRGEHLRSFFPEYLGSGVVTPQPPPGRVVVQPVPDRDTNDGPVVIRRALINPPGTEEEGEWVELKNITAAPIDVTGWRLADKLGRPQGINGVIAEGAEQRFTIDRNTSGSMMLGNSSGRIVLINSAGVTIASVRYPQIAEGEIKEF